MKHASAWQVQGLSLGMGQNNNQYQIQARQVESPLNDSDFLKSTSGGRSLFGHDAPVADAYHTVILAGLMWLLLAWSGDLLAEPTSNRTSGGATLTPSYVQAQISHDKRQQASINQDISQQQIRHGQLRYVDTVGNVKIEMPMDTQVSMQVSGWLNRVSVRQVFRNDTLDWLSGTYLFPLPTNAAVDSLRMHIGERVIEGQIQTKKQAKQTFEQAKVAGKRASLVEQQRPNMFTSSVANLAPDETLIVEIVYQEIVAYNKGLFSLRFPMTVTPRYSPANTLTPLEAQAISTPVKRSEQMFLTGLQDMFHRGAVATHLNSGQIAKEDDIQVSLTVTLDAGLNLAVLESAYHDVNTQMAADGRYQVQLTPGYSADRDFVLQWQVQPGLEPQAVMFSQLGLSHPLTKRESHKTAGPTELKQPSQVELQTARHKSNKSDQYSLLMLMPPLAKTKTNTALPRELILVIDTSGSMSGGAIEQAKAALLEALNSLAPQDNFNVIAFNHEIRLFASQAVAANRKNLNAAKTFVARLYSDGGTELGLALNAALAVSTNKHVGSAESGRDLPQQKLRQVIFITDGAVGNEQQLFELISNQLGESRLFTVGIGSAPNSHFMERAAEVGRGSFTYIGKIDEVKHKIDGLINQIKSPVLTDIKVAYADGTIPDYWPSQISDLYYGEPLLVSIKSRADNLNDLLVSGNIGDQFWQERLDTEELHRQTQSGPKQRTRSQIGKGLDLIWARQYISALSLAKNSSNAEKTKQQIIGLALKYHLVSEHTSLVAVDTTPARSTQQLMKEGEVRQHLPHHNLAAMPQTATASQLLIHVGLLMVAISLVILFYVRPNSVNSDSNQYLK